MSRTAGRRRGQNVSDYTKRILAELSDPNNFSPMDLCSQVRGRMRAEAIPLGKTDLPHAVEQTIHRLRQAGNGRINPETLAPYRNGSPTATAPKPSVPTTGSGNSGTRYVIVPHTPAKTEEVTPAAPKTKKDDPFAWLNLPDTNSEKALRLTREYCEAVGGAEVAEKWIGFWKRVSGKE